MKMDAQEDFFAAAPPSKVKRMLLALWASVPGACLNIVDAVGAYVHARARRRAQAELSREDHEEGTGLIVGSWNMLR